MSDPLERPLPELIRQRVKNPPHLGTPEDVVLATLIQYKLAEQQEASAQALVGATEALVGATNEVAAATGELGRATKRLVYATWGLVAGTFLLVLVEALVKVLGGSR